MIYTLPHIIFHSAERFPDSEAFRCGNSAITFVELAGLMNQIAGLLAGLGVRRSDRVGILMNRCLETAPAVYGIMNAGAAYVPLDPQAPPARIGHVIRDCGIRHLITHPSQLKTLENVLKEEIILDSLIGIKREGRIPSFSWKEITTLPAHRKYAGRTLEQDLAYVMYTSGSTGAPKGIMHTHYSGLSYAKLAASLYGLNKNDRVGNHAPLHFDISTLGYFAAPLAGAATVIVSDAYTKMPASLSQLMEKERLTVWYSVPLALTQLLERGVPDQRDMSALRWVLYGGEPFPSKHLRALMERWPHAKFSNVYGPAEVNQCTYYHLPGPPGENESVPLGQVWDNTEMLIIDENDHVVPEGETGELLIRSSTMMRGYWGQPDLTQKAWYHRTRVPDMQETFYRTGDLVRLDKHRNLQFLGRKDRQVKFRGYRVELDEVAAVLLSHEAVQEAAVFVVPVDREGLVINAAVMLKTGKSIEESALRTHMAVHLPPYAIPASVSIRTDLPRTSTGKIDHKALQKMALE